MIRVPHGPGGLRQRSSAVRSPDAHRDQRHLPLVHGGQQTGAFVLHQTSQRSVSAAMPPLPVCAYRSNQWRYRGRCDSIQFAVDKRVFIAGFGLYGSSCGSAEYSARIELKRQGATVAQRLIKYFSDGSSSTFPVFFDNPVQIEPDTFYTASVVLDGNELSYFGQEGMTEVQSGKVTFQFQCSSDSTNGTGVQGGQGRYLSSYSTPKTK
uniref:BTB (POZ) domain containing 3a n=1 Tax=Neogobius melanostomus TaxID=47308 RepID=A0A8C6TCU5_9GOBI